MSGTLAPDAPGVRRCPAWWFAAALVPPIGLLLAGAPLAWLARLLYLAPPISLLIALVAGVRAWRAGALPLRALLPGLPTAIGLVLVAVAISPPAMRMQFDETSLLSVSQNMHTQRLAVMTTGALPFDGELVPVENTVDKRPPLFAFLVSVLHDLTGARLGNAFAVNALLLGLGLLLVFALVRPRLGTTAAITGQVLVIAVPLVVVVATSAGFELLATVLLLAVVLAANGFVQRPDAARAHWLLALSGLLAQARYESLPAGALVLALAWWGTRRRFVPTRGTVVLALVQGCLLAAGIAQLVHARDPDFYPEAAGAPLVSLGHLVEHLPPFVAALFAPSLGNPLPGVLAWFGTAGLGLWLVRRRATFGALLLAAPVVLVTLLALLWFFGDVRRPAALRLFLPATVACALLPLLLLPTGRRAAAASGLLLAAALALAGSRLVEVARGSAFPRLPNAELADAMAHAAAAVDGADRSHALWIATTAQHLIVHGHAALSPEAFARRASEVQRSVQSGQVRAVYVLETPLDAAFAPAFGSPQQILRTAPSDVVHRTDAPPLVVHRLRLR